YNQIICGSNGVITFNTNVANGYCAWSYSASIPSTSLFANTIFGPYHDIDPAVSGNMYYSILGSYPCRTFCVSWYNVAMYSSSCNSMKATHMIVLYENTNVIEVYMKSKPVCSSWNGGRACIGVQNSSASAGVVAPGRNTSVWTATNEAWRFTPSGTPNYTLTWWQGGTQIGTGSTITVCPTTATTYTAQVDYSLCTGSNLTLTDNVTVNVNNATNVSVTPTSATVCNGQSTTLTASGGTSYTWAPGTGLNTTSGPTVIATPTQTTTYTMTGISPNGCTSNIPITINVNQNPAPSITPSAPSICPGNSVNLVAGGANSYSWSPSTGLSCTNCPNPTATLSSPTTYIVTAQSSAGCTGSTTVTVSIYPVPSVTVTPASAAICNGNSVGLTANGASTYSWTPSTGLSCTNCPNPTANPTVQTTYSVTGTSTQGCTNSTTITVSINPNPNVTITPANPVICFSDSITLTANGATAYSWSPATGLSSTSGSVVHASPPQTTTYTITGTSGAGCVSTANITLVVHPIPTSSFTVSAPNCTGNTATINYTGTGTAGASYAWNFAGGNASPGTGQGPHQVTWASPGSYNVSLTVTENNCTSPTTSHTVLVSNLSTNPASHTDVICFGENNGTATVYPINGSEPYSYYWSTSPPQSGQTASGLIIGTYYVTITDSVGCTTTESITISQPPLLQLYVTHQDEGCESSCDGTISTNVSGGVMPYDYDWSCSGMHTSSIMNVCTGTCDITVTDANNCTVNGSATIITNSPIEAAAITDSRTVLMPGVITFYFTGSGASSFMWYFGDGSTSTQMNPTHQYTEEGEYTMLLVVNSGAPDYCLDSITMIITVVQPSEVTIPNFFSPNGDDSNPTFKIESKSMKSEHMEIYNRWGKKIFEWSEVGGEWDGKSQSSVNEAEGTYFYIFTGEGNDGKDFRMRGCVTLMR
ncbi:MAG: gliding motility-associated C-terminal domain-containing protein, partial [Bacteroidales bacterium]|nr:gliding motility-associated C-terminal domain-containing protein [Bacteroidales bacterium]